MKRFKCFSDFTDFFRKKTTVMPHVVIKLKKTPFVNHIFTSFLAGSKLLLYIAPGFCYISLILFFKRKKSSD